MSTSIKVQAQCYDKIVHYDMQYDNDDDDDDDDDGDFLSYYLPVDSWAESAITITTVKSLWAEQGLP